MNEMLTRNIPPITAETAEYWASCARHELQIQRCLECGTCQFFPRIMCTACSGKSLRWVRASGRGQVKSFTIVRRAVSEAYAAEVPYVVALVELEEGPTMMSNVVVGNVDEIRIGMPLEVVFDDWPEGVSIPKFKPRMV
ncbi:MAG: OB-fold domain-containing protein [Gallionella sp.]|nr:OB-fold domain-containing protein [Gallionella sp.]